MLRFVGKIVAFLCVLGLVAPAMAAPDWSLPPRLKPSVGTVSTVPVLRGQSRAPGLSSPPRLRPGTSSPAQPNTSNTNPATTQVAATSARGALCRDRSIIGERLAPIQGPLAGCRIDAPVRVHSIGGVRFNPAAVMTCETAGATKEWLERSAVPEWGRLGGGLTQIEVAASYACRTRNNQAGEKLSEHGSARAIDIRAFTLQNGVSVSVEDGWSSTLSGQVLRKIHAGACKSFTNVLGPEADRFHRDHLHFDTAPGRGVCQ